MSKFIISLTRDTSQDGYIAIKAEDEDAAKRKYLDGDYSAEVVWSEGDWVGDSDVLEVLPYEGNEELLDPPAPAFRRHPRQLATVLAALRYWQRCGEFAGQDILDIATNSGEFEDLNGAEIDDLCMQLNCQ